MIKFERLQYKYDMFVYKLAYSSINRLCEYNPGFVYLFKLHIDDWLGKNNLGENVKNATESFYKSLNEQKDKK